MLSIAARVVVGHLSADGELAKTLAQAQPREVEVLFSGGG